VIELSEKLSKGVERGMQTYRFETTVKKDGTLDIKGLPFSVGEKVEVLVRLQEDKHASKKQYTLRGKPFRLTKPFESVAEDDWDAPK
jgi:hypothetical protein